MNVINEVIKIVGPLGLEQKKIIQNLLRWLRKTCLSVGYWMEKSDRINSLVLDQANQIHNLNGILLYLMEGLLPLLTAYCTEMSLHITGSNFFNIISHKNIAVLIDIGNAFAVSIIMLYFSCITNFMYRTFIV